MTYLRPEILKEAEAAEYRPLHSMRLGKHVLHLDWIHTETRDVYLGVIDGLVVVGAPERAEAMFYLIDMARGMVDEERFTDGALSGMAH